MDFRKRLIEAAATAMQGHKCDCEGCDCHYAVEDAEKLVTAIGPVMIAECTKAVHDDLVSRLTGESQ